MSILRRERPSCYDNPMRKTHIIHIDTTDVVEFCDMAKKCGFPVSVASTANRRKTVDARSYLDVLALDLNRNLVVSYRGVDEAYEAFLEKYII